jgi:hypothetical protein
MKDAIAKAQDLNEALSGELVVHNKTGNLYRINHITPFCSSAFPDLEGKLVVHYMIGDNHYTRFYDEFFEVDKNNGIRRFELV